MPNQTPNYNLTKPLQTENYNVDVFNTNADIIDTTIKNIDTQLNKNTNNIATNTNNIAEIKKHTSFVSVVSPGYKIISESNVAFDNFIFYCIYIERDDGSAFQTDNVGRPVLTTGVAPSITMPLTAIGLNSQGVLSGNASAQLISNKTLYIANNIANITQIRVSGIGVMN